MDMIYKNYKINDKPNEWGYFEAINTIDCDAPTIISNTVEKLKIEINELE